MVKKVMRRPNSSRMRSERPLPVIGAHARGHLLHHDEGDGGRDKRPQQGVAVLGAGLRVGQDAAGVVIDIGGDEARPDDREERDQAIGQDAEGRRREAPPKVFRLDVRSHCGCARDYRQRKIASGPRGWGGSMPAWKRTGSAAAELQMPSRMSCRTSQGCRDAEAPPIRRGLHTEYCSRQSLWPSFSRELWRRGCDALPRVHRRATGVNTGADFSNAS